MKYAILFVLIFSFITFLFLQDANNSITIDLIDGDQITTVEINKNKDFSLDVPQKIGYIFDGWYNDETEGIRYTDQDGLSINPADSDMPKTLYARYTPTEYVLYIDDILITDISILFDHAIPKLPLPTSTEAGMEFIGYFSEINQIQITNENGNALEAYETITKDNYTSFKIEDHAIYLISKFEHKDFTINYFIDDHLDYTKTVSFNDIIDSHYFPEKDNHTFINWYMDPAFETPVSKSLLLNDESLSINLYAKFLLSTPNVLSFTSINQDQAYLVSLQSDELEEIVIPDTYFGKPVIKIGNFQNCQAKSIILPQTINEIEIAAFKNCTNLIHMTLPNDIETIPEEAFMNAFALESIEFPSSLIAIDDHAFAYTNIKTLHITKGLITLSENAFMGTKQLSTITIDEDQTIFEVNDNVLLKKKGPYRILMLYPSGSNLYRYEIPENITEISDYAFYEAQHLSEIIFNEQIHKIGDYAFSNLNQLTYIDLTLDTSHPQLMIGNYAFSNNTSLKTIIINHEEIVSIESNVLENSTTHLDIYVPTEILNDYHLDSDWGSYQEIIQPKNLIFGQYILKEITLNDIDGYEIKYYLGDQIEIIIPNIINSKPILSIDSYAFAYKTQLETLHISENIKVIKDYAFADCNTLTTVYLNPIIPPSITSETFINSQETIYFYIISQDINVIETYKSHVDWSIYQDQIYSNND